MVSSKRNQMVMPKHSELSAFAADVHRLAVEKGWYETPRAWDELVFLIQGEIHEASECLRSGHTPEQSWCGSGAPGHGYEDGGRIVLGNDGEMLVEVDDVLVDYDPSKHGKPEGFLVELADACIRALDAMTYRGAKPLIVPPPQTAEANRIADTTARRLIIRHALSLSAESSPRDLSDMVREFLEWGYIHGLPLWEIMLLKHEYNKTRQVRHGKAY